MVVLSGKKVILCDLVGEFRPLTRYLDILSLTDIFFIICEECARMAAIPHGAFAACKLRSQKRTDMIVSGIKSSEKPESKKFDNKKLLEYTPVKYNSKLMKSIWGLYNRYSPHNMKGNDDEGSCDDIKLQQPLAVAATAITHDLVMAMSSGKEWNFPGKPRC